MYAAAMSHVASINQKAAAFNCSALHRCYLPIHVLPSFTNINIILFHPNHRRHHVHPLLQRFHRCHGILPSYPQLDLFWQPEVMLSCSEHVAWCIVSNAAWYIISKTTFTILRGWTVNDLSSSWRIQFSNEIYRDLIPNILPLSFDAPQGFYTLPTLPICSMNFRCCG